MLRDELVPRDVDEQLRFAEVLAEVVSLHTSRNQQSMTNRNEPAMSLTAAEVMLPLWTRMPRLMVCSSST